MIKGIIQDGVVGKVTSIDGPIVAVSNIAYRSCDLCNRNLEPTLNLTVEGNTVFVCRACLEGLVAGSIGGITSTIKYHDENDCYSCRICGATYDNPTEESECCFDEKLEEICPEECKK